MMRCGGTECRKLRADGTWLIADGYEKYLLALRLTVGLRLRLGGWLGLFMFALELTELVLGFSDDIFVVWILELALG